MESFSSDIRYAIRNLIARRGFTAIAVITLALGVGGTTTIFSMVNALLVKPLNFPELDRVVAVWENQPSRGVERNEASMANYIDWRRQSQSFEYLGLYRWWSANLTGVEPPERIQGFLVTANFLDVVGVRPMLGRGFTADEDQPGKDPVAVLTYGLWQRRFGGDSDIINQTITLNGVARTVIGVMPQGYSFPKGAEVLAPLTITPEMQQSRQNHSYLVVGRLKPNISIQQTQADLDAIAARLEKEYTETNTGWGVVVYPIVEDTVRMYKTALWIMMAAVGLVLLIACANVANLMLARAAGRQKEIALRSALGASRWRIVRQLLTESLMLALLGGALGSLIAYWGIDLFRALNPGEAAKFAPGWEQLGLNLPVLAFTLAISLLSGLLFGLAPAWQASKPDLNTALKESGHQTTFRSQRLRRLLVISEIAFSLMLLVAAGLLIRSFAALLRTDPGFNSENILTLNLILPAAKYKEPQQRASFYSELVTRAEIVAGVESAAAINYLPLGGSNSSDAFLIEGIPEPAPGQDFIGRYRVCTPRLFETLGIRILKGRPFTEHDRDGAPPVIIVNETLSKKFWPNTDPIGKRMRFAGPIKTNPWMEVVGVSEDVRHELNQAVTPDFYLPHAQDPWSSMILVAKTKVEPLALAAALRQQVWSLDKDQPVFDVRTMQQVRLLSVNLYSFSMGILAIFASVALILAAIGIYGVMAFTVTQRTHEIGIRMALGASALDVLRLVVKNGMTLAVIGVIAGLAGAWIVTRYMDSLLVGVQPTDALTLVAVSILLVTVALIACFIPARRATKVDPLVALRCE